ncbi:MAG: carboxypeptidase regulatory-like domain-containing protein [candidate division Zixibacteria bacterium]|nr:carboxypeptidase regulatory-like domain-containing protein [candidate division Zixibacteria bacterium]
MAKKLLILVLVILCASASAQVEGLDIWTGGSFDSLTWNSTMIVSPDSWIDIPVYLMGRNTDVWVSSLLFPLGINTTYVTAFNAGASQMYYPFTEWDDAGFCNFNCNPPLPSGWCSLSFLGFSNTGGDSNPWGHWEIPTLSLSYQVHITSDNYIGMIIGDAIGPGHDPYGAGNACAGDTLGGGGYNVYDHYASFYFDFPTGNSVITGTVTNWLNEPVEGITVTALSTSENDETDGLGRYTITGLFPDTYDISFEGDGSIYGYIDVIHSGVTVEDYDTVELDISMGENAVYIWAGGTFNGINWHDTMTAAPDSWVDIPVYFMGGDTTVWAANLIFPLGINTTYVDLFNIGDCQLSYPFTEWDEADFCNFNCDSPLPSGWCSLSFLGYANMYTPVNPWGHWEAPTLGLSYRVHIINDVNYLGQTFCDAMGPGHDPFGAGNAGAGDTLGGVGYGIYDNYACILFDFPPGYCMVSGTITDNNGVPLDNVHIEIANGSSTSSIIGDDWTNPDGSYSILNVPTGYVSLIFSHADYVDTTAEIYLGNGANYQDMIMWPNAEEDVVFWFGNLDDSPLIGAINQRLYMNVYMQNTDEAYGGDIHVPFAVEDQYIDELLIDKAKYFYPFTEWDSAGFDGVYSSPPNPTGWSSISFFANAQTGSPWLHFKLPTRILTFAMKAANNPSIVDDTVACIGIGAHPGAYPFGVADTLGSIYASVEHISEVAFVLEPEVYNYRAADVNMYNGAWPPVVMGSDVVYLVNYFSGSPSSLPCMINGFWCSADVNGDCTVMGSDVTRLVNHFKGIIPYSFCPDYPAAWYVAGDCPAEPPPGWPPCE